MNRRLLGVSGRMARLGVRQALVITALLALGSLILVIPSSRAGVAARPLLLPLVLTLIGVVRGWYWSRWMGLGGALAVLPWVTVLLFTPGAGGSGGRVTLALTASLVLFGALLGRDMFDRYEGSDRRVDWRGRGMSLVRWTIVLNIASLLNLYLFIAAYRHRVEWHSLIPGLLLGGLLTGLLLLARQKTVGVLVVALASLLFLPAGGYFVWKEAAGRGEAMLFAVLFLPGIVTAVATLLAFGGPMYRYLRDPD